MPSNDSSSSAAAEVGVASATTTPRIKRMRNPLWRRPTVGRVAAIAGPLVEGEGSLTAEELCPDLRDALAILADIPRRSAYVPTLELRIHFQALVDRRLARSRGIGLGGEGFSPTELGRKAARKFESRSRPGRGFASMTLERRREVASMGGRAVPAENRSFARNRDLASDAGRRGGEKSGGPRNRSRSGGAP